MFLEFEKLFRYGVWANRRHLDAIKALPDAEQEALPLLAHVLGAERTWLNRINGTDDGQSPWNSLSLDQASTLIDELASGYQTLLDLVGEAGLDRVIHYRSLAGVEFSNPLRDILTHVAIHGAYHRGQVAKAIGRAGGQAPSTDYIAFVREESAAGRHG